MDQLTRRSMEAFETLNTRRSEGVLTTQRLENCANFKQLCGNSKFNSDTDEYSISLVLNPIETSIGSLVEVNT
eukprot:UN01489